MATLEQRVSRIEGAYEHLATKADLSQLENRLISDINQLENRLVNDFNQLETRLIKWMVGLQLGSIVALAAIVTAVATAIKLLD